MLLRFRRFQDCGKRITKVSLFGEQPRKREAVADFVQNGMNMKSKNTTIHLLFAELIKVMLLVFSYIVSLSARPKAFYGAIRNKLFKRSFNRGTSKAWTSDKSILFCEGSKGEKRTSFVPSGRVFAIPFAVVLNFPP